MLIIVLFIIIFNIVSILLMYHCLNDINKKEKLVFIAAGTAIMYILTSIVYWISTRNVEITEVSETGKDLITFLFVPINAILVLPLFAKSYYSYQNGKIDGRILKNRGILLGIILIIVLIIECSYFENIQKGVVDLINNQQEIIEEKENESTNQFINSNIIENSNQISNETLQENRINDINNITNTSEENNINNENNYINSNEL